MSEKPPPDKSFLNFSREFFAKLNRAAKERKAKEMADNHTPLTDAEIEEELNLWKGNEETGVERLLVRALTEIKRLRAMVEKSFFEGYYAGESRMLKSNGPKDAGDAWSKAKSNALNQSHGRACPGPEFPEKF